MSKLVRYIIVVIVFFPLYSFGQYDYYKTDSSSFVGVKILDGGDSLNSHVCQILLGEEMVTYTPYELNEYGFSNGQVFLSRNIRHGDTTIRVFLERLGEGEGKASLYFYGGNGMKTFYVEKDNMELVELTKKDSVNQRYKDQLLKLTADCKKVANSCRLTRYTKVQLAEVISRYNDCVLKPFPHIKIGVLAGYEWSLVSLSTKSDKVLKNMEATYDRSVFLGFFYEQPISLSNYSFRTEVYFVQHSYTLNYATVNEDFDLLMDHTSVRVPLTLKYTMSWNRFRPFLNIGGIYSYNLKLDHVLYSATFDNNVIEINSRSPHALISKNELGYSIGCGLEFDVDYKRSVFLDLKWSHQYGVMENILNKNSIINVSTGINF